IQFTQTKLDYDLPSTGNREKDIVLRISQSVLGLYVQTIWSQEIPKPAVGIDEEPHDCPSNSLKRASGRGASKSSAIRPLPASIPIGRSPLRAGVSRSAKTMTSAGPVGRSAGRSISTRWFSGIMMSILTADFISGSSWR